jgi:hypothetical protein
MRNNPYKTKSGRFYEGSQKPYFDSAISIMKCNRTVKDCIRVFEKSERKVFEGPSKFYEV